MANGFYKLRSTQHVLWSAVEVFFMLSNANHFLEPSPVFPPFRKTGFILAPGLAISLNECIQMRPTVLEEDGTMQKEDKCLPGGEPLSSVQAIPLFDEGWWRETRSRWASTIRMMKR